MKYLQSLKSLEAYKNVRKTSLAVSGSLCTIGGLVADVLQPIAPFAFYIFLISLASFLALALLYVLGRKNLIGALTLTAIACLAMGLISLLQHGDQSEERGIVATTIPAIASLQESLGFIEQKLDEIKQDTETIKQSTERIESKSNEMLESLDAIKEEITTRSDNGGVIQNPDTPEDHYHNARIHELGGDYAAARRSYLEYFKSDLPQLDPHLRFISFLKVQEGTAGARESYNAVTARSSGPIPPYARILLLRPIQRINGLKAYLANHPDFAPAAYHLSLEYSINRLGSQTISDMRSELEYLKTFQDTDENGGLLRHLVDQDLAQEWRSDAQARRLTIENNISTKVLEKPVSISWMANNAGWTANIQISEPTTEIKWNVKGQATPASTGTSAYNDPNTGLPAPNKFFNLPLNQPNSQIEIRYTDTSGAERGPYEFTFETQKESNDGNRRILEMTTTSWISFRDYDGSVLLYFTHLLTYRGSLSKIEYGIDTETPDQNFAFPAWNQSGFAPIDGSSPIYLTVPSNTTFATVRLTYKNDQQSQIIRVTR